MSHRRTSSVWRAVGISLLLPALIGVPAVSAATPRDRTAPTAPTNLRVTGTTPYAISLAWTASKDSVGVTGYKVCCVNTNSQTFNGPATSVTYTAGVESGRSFSLFVVAFDAAGNISKSSNSVTGTTPRDITPPSKPTVTVTDVGARHVSLAWSTVDDGPNVWFTVFQDGAQMLTATRSTTGTFALLQPETAYTFTVRARDFGGNNSPLSDPLTVTTEARDTTDTTPPTMPGNLHTTLAMPDGETWLSWTQSTDNGTAQPYIEYRILVNSVYDSSVVGFGRQIVYGTPFSHNTYSVVAVDESGNESAPATIVVDNT